MLNEAKVKQKETTEKKLAIIQDQFKAAGVSNLFGTKKEVVALPGILADNEVVKYATSGTVNGNTVLMLCTDMRVLFIDKGLMYGIRFTEIPLDMVNSVNYQKGLILGSISIVNGAVITQINSVTKETAPIMADAIKKARNEFIKPQQTVTQATPQKSTADELREFKSLMDDGILTQEEFTLKKKQLLGL
ncbi:MAG TPA: hypothetical protein DEP42_05390 [Ruminococcaceae bacterium]|nr:hypothetical protein [Oscillospiraceae bacterium]